MRISHITITPVDNGWILNIEHEREYAQRDSKVSTKVFTNEEGVLDQLKTSFTMHKIAVDNSKRGY